MDYLKLKCTNDICKLCHYVKPPMSHYQGKRHEYYLKEHFKNTWKWSSPINVPNLPINNIKDIKTLSDMFKFYRIKYPEEFIQYLKLRLNRKKCNLCRVDFPVHTATDVQMWNQMIIDHCKGMKHSQALMTHFEEWRKPKQANNRPTNRPTPARRSDQAGLPCQRIVGTGWQQPKNAP